MVKGSAASEQEPGRLTLRAVLLGVFISLLMAVAAPFSRYVMHNSPLVFSSFSWGVTSAWLVVVLANAWGGRHLRLWSPLGASELALVLMIAAVGSSLTTHEVAGLLVTNIGGYHYHASPENRYYEIFGDIIPPWVVPTDMNHAVSWLFDGAPRNRTPRWADWLVPLFWHGGFTAAMYCVQFALVALMRRHWVEHERLVFPIMQIPLELTRPASDGRLMPPWMRGKLFWIGFGIPFVLLMMEMASWFWPGVPFIPAELGEVSFGREYPGLPIRLFWPVIAISFFANVDVTFSLWFFRLAGTLVSGWLTKIGISTVTGSVPMHWLNTGALIVMVAWFMWQGRHHLIGAAKQALGRKDGVDDKGELVSFRTAYLMLFGGVAYMVIWMTNLGTDPFVALLLVVVSQTIFLGIARLAFEAGIFHVNAPLHPCNIVAETFGTDFLSRGTLAGLAMVFWKFSNIKSLFLVTLGNSAALSRMGPINVPRRKFSAILAFVVPVTTMFAIWYTLHLGFSRGGYNFNDWVFQAAAEEPYVALSRWLTDPRPAYTSHLSFLGIGAVLMGILTAMRYLFTWWPLHPIGLAICFSYHISMSFLSILIAWAVKSLVLRLGGISLYQRTIPLFLGLLIGSLAGGMVCFFVDLIWFPGAGHTVFYR